MSGSDCTWVASCYWEDYPWKNELHEQTRRVELHFSEALDESFCGDHSPLHMLERALVLAAFSMRRLVEKRLVTERLADSTRPIKTFLATDDFRPPFHGSSGGRIFENYNFEAPVFVPMKIADLANEIIHSSQLLVLNAGSGDVPDGLLVASDWKMRRRVLHLPVETFRSLADEVLNDRIRMKEESWDPETNQVRSRRE